MLTKQVPLSNDQVDKHGDRMSLGALESMVRQTNSKIICSHVEHDFSFPPIGRMEQAELLEHNGVNWVIGKFSLFERSDIDNENPLGDREVVIHEQKEGSISITYDRSYELSGITEDVKELQALLDNETETEYELKKSVEPVSTLTLLIGMGATFAVANYFKGFFGEAGKESWQALKKLIIKNKEINPETEKHYQFVFIFENEYYKVEVMILLKNPEPESFEWLVKENQGEIDKKIIEYYEQEIRAKRIVFIIEKNLLKHAYSVRRCGTPFDIEDIEGYNRLLESKKINFTKDT